MFSFLPFLLVNPILPLLHELVFHTVGDRSSYISLLLVSSSILVSCFQCPKMAGVFVSHMHACMISLLSVIRPAERQSYGRASTKKPVTSTQVASQQGT
ncbi:uncharacterized protein LOC127810395 isoform X2 [Diospyros lotus]|uniref:uncharacterized protein LOC127810395 isoform X2 n=1 Tax=Diospyros lotus TaxID=55363 RepID=UPI002253DB6B|nr:uncharacterized protein LOC127810395 isoform X2 [Diospyros lotus]